MGKGAENHMESCSDTLREYANAVYGEDILCERLQNQNQMCLAPISEKKPIKKIRKSLKDFEHLNRRSDIHSNTQPKSYKGLVVLKPWGNEFLIYENNNVAIWMLRIDKDQSTSMHAHPNKKTSLIVLEGEILCDNFTRRSLLKEKECIIIENGVFHSSKALPENGAVILEIETPPDKVDLIRLDDKYGRTKENYESISHMVTDQKLCKEMGCFYMNCIGKSYKSICSGEMSFQIMEYDEADSIKNFDKAAVYCVVEGKIRVKDENMEEGDIFFVSDPDEVKMLSERISILSIK